MPSFSIIHPDQAIGETLAKTLQQAWPQAQFQTSTVEEAAPNALLICFSPDIANKQIGRTWYWPDQPWTLAGIIWSLRQAMTNITWTRTLAVGKASLETLKRTWYFEEKVIELTEKEVALLVYMAQADRPVTRHDLLSDVWQYAADTETHTIETHIHRLRQKIEPDPNNPQFILTGKDGYFLGE